LIRHRLARPLATLRGLSRNDRSSSVAWVGADGKGAPAPPPTIGGFFMTTKDEQASPFRRRRSRRPTTGRWQPLRLAQADAEAPIRDDGRAAVIKLASRYSGEDLAAVLIEVRHAIELRLGEAGFDADAGRTAIEALDAAVAMSRNKA
jgi:hypothetical protein